MSSMLADPFDSCAASISAVSLLERAETGTRVTQYPRGQNANNAQNLNGNNYYTGECFIKNPCVENTFCPGTWWWWWEGKRGGEGGRDSRT